MNLSSTFSSGDQTDRLLLFVTGNAPRSRRARDNLSDALKRLGQPSTAAEEIDLTRDPGQTLKYGIFATPALVRTNGPGENEILYGDLSEQGTLERFLLRQE
jgi:circadian clock protein KaiB